ncbi:alcohol dehydrogenase catalytic domain-containing protein [Parasphingorhabdus halotolerans]|uniref:Alcohol dehydrogenase catalytic domain-containing protein n=1 Tax=Parasphingorhabdus halotolerans TaxID=2725558 RepID=A0A6H2DL83_9SPHN|nr:alcohol dehydrogenase catalytic domain-containing protein [Parasphingorhabdus halotolerans]QJB68511.1 alcohol dehydrogenase catalytic domain-containing protein [Parasphingorhabdus halotolerans]
MNPTYRAAVCTALTGPDSIVIEDLTPKSLASNEIRIAVKAAGLNFPDLLMTYGKYQFRPDPPFVPGLEVAGVVIEIADGVEDFAVGDRVLAGSKGAALPSRLSCQPKTQITWPPPSHLRKALAGRPLLQPHGML